MNAPRWLWIFGIVMFLAVLILQMLTVLVIGFVGPAQDFGSYWVAASRTASGGTPYDWLANERPIAGDALDHVYPPLLSVLLMPLTPLLDYDAARAAWLVFSSLCLAAGLWLSWRTQDQQARGEFAYIPPPELKSSRALVPEGGPGLAHDATGASTLGLVVLAGLALLPWIGITLAVGQISCQLLLLVAAIYALLRSHRLVAAGMLVGFGMYLKVFPALIGVYLLLRRRWQSCFAAALIAIALVALTWHILGWEPHWTYLTAVLPAQARLFGLPQNVSITGFVTHLLIDNNDTIPIVAADAMGRALIAVLTVGLLAATAYAVWRAGDLPAAQAPAYGLVVVTALVITPANGTYNLVIVALPLAVAIARVRRAWRGFSVLLVTAMVLLSLPTDLCDLLPVRIWCFDYWVANALPMRTLPWRIGWANLLMAGPFYGLLLLWSLLFRLCLDTASYGQVARRQNLLGGPR
jgi:hypothetical protein